MIRERIVNRSEPAGGGWGGQVLASLDNYLAKVRSPEACGRCHLSPDYAQRHGFYDVAERFYIEPVPEAERQEIREFYRRRYSVEMQ